MSKYLSFGLLILLFCPGYLQAQGGFWLKVKNDNSTEEVWRYFDEELKVQSTLDSILTTAVAEGYLAAYLEKTTEKTDSLEYNLVSGDRFKLVGLRKGNVPDPVWEEIPIGKASFAEWNHWSSQVLNFFENSGYPFVQLRLDSLQREGKEVLASINLETGPLITWDSVEVSGNTNTKAIFIQNLTGIKPGTPFSQKEFIESSKTLQNTPYFELSNAPGLSFQNKSAKPTFYLRDRNVNVIDGVIGLLPNENEPGKVLITGQLDLELYHLGGKGRDIAVHWLRMNPQSQSLGIQAKESFIFRSPLSVQLGFNLLKQDSTFIKRAFSLDFDYRFSGTGNIRFFTNREASDLISTSGYQDLKELPEVADYRWNQYGIGLNFNWLDSQFFPRRGMKVQIEMATGNKKILQNTGIPSEVYQGLDLNSPQVTGNFQVEQHVYVRPLWGMWFRGSGGFTRNKNLFLNDLFRIGGLKSIRGFNENFFFAKTYGYLNMEQRLIFGENSYLMLFSDIGLLTNPYEELTRDIPISFGAGINLETGNGVFRFIYGLGKSNLQPLSFSYSKIHFGYLARF
ncbi:BamA/TamA family outer membrane protein [Algoriphagus machipongonensis]|uniref:Outer membrane protein n=1 Tax=Algoriphagus machipongonensis TaxID=388413 RepID=A3HY00_9BACT|nr:BamA/TamA family outer membrane protein [Algoriphagus machipongonensis]EAZ81473.1 putative outer membrane protein [Algoriphagus machipongonensis]